MKKITRWIPLALIVLVLIAALYFRLYEYFTFQALAKNHQLLQQWTSQHYLAVVLAYMAIYIAVVAASIPGATILTMTGGFLFGYVFGTLYVVISATIGATFIFLAVKTTFGVWLESRARGWVARMEQGFKKNAFNYLLFLRLVPLFPF